ncbi:hypothetical protein ENSA5_47700 [Enhygromyxa salina]|uniref:N-ATPase, AtpR subunit n=1 Tax=Enhygromyxa salina TaxID=215803 RepID=A0A2S9XI86_9BACT|nr:hypothetical protein [Enhygromyxa salina]PRP92589.1 hypothetical protein ENSA5_47700 [Enhygromyxa salina]
MDPLELVIGALVGAALAGVHAWAVYRAAARVVDARRADALLAFPVRVVAPAAGLFALALSSPAALTGGVLAFAIGQVLARARLTRARD